MSTIQADSLVTLNIRIADAQTATIMHSTFEATPLTLKLGSGELMTAIEQRLLGLVPGRHERFTLEPGEAFGPYRQDLVERVARTDVPEEMELEVDTVYAFTAPDGSNYPGLVRELTDNQAVVDFNHPLAGRSVAVEVEVIGVI